MIYYTFSIWALQLLYRMAAPFHAKAQLFVKGRYGIFEKLKFAFADNKAPILWMHCASLGEFEQGRPVMEAFKKQNPGYKILLTFFSPSGYEPRKDYRYADHVFYLPWDLPGNAKQFIGITKPAIAIFIKYEFWHHYASELKRNNIPLLSASSIFRPHQVFFNWYGGFFRSTLKKFTHFFVQTPQSIELLKKIGITETTLAGDTRFDRVFEITQQPVEIEIARRFKGSEKTFVLGSIWPEDMDVLAPFINEHGGTIKFILAPHEIDDLFLKQIEESIHIKSFRYSKPPQDLDSYSVMIIDNVGMLSKLYRYGEFAYVGGAFGKGLHNILEAACYGIPIFFGNKNYQKFQEANDLIMRGGAFAIGDYPTLKKSIELFSNHPESFLLACEVTREYVKENLGATQKIVSYCKKIMKI